MGEYECFLETRDDALYEDRGEPMIALCVDDEPAMLDLLREAVEASPDIEEAFAFEEESDALVWAETHRVDVAFLDIELHKMKGTEVARRLREKTPYLPIIFCTGHSEYALEAMQLHADGYLLKPIYAEDVQKELDYLMGKNSFKPLLTVLEDSMVLKDKEGKTVVFHRSRTRNLARLLLEARGKPLTTEELCDRLFGRNPGFYPEDRNYFFQLVSDFSKALAQHGATEVLIKSAQSYALNMKQISVINSASESG